MLGVFEVDQVTPLELEDPDPLELMFVTGVIILFYTRIDTSSAPDAPGKVQPVPPQRIRNSLLRTDLKFFTIFLKVSLFKFGNDPLLLFRRHLLKTFLQEVLGFFLRTGGEKRHGETG